MWVCGYKNGTQWYWRGEHIDVPLNIATWVSGQPDIHGGRQGCVAVISDKAHGFVTVQCIGLLQIQLLGMKSLAMMMVIVTKTLCARIINWMFWIVTG